MLTGLYFYLRAIRYSMMATEVARRLGILELSESIYKEAPGSSLMRRIMVGKFVPYGKFTSLYVIAGPLVLLMLWVFVAFHQILVSEQMFAQLDESYGSGSDLHRLLQCSRP